MLTMCQSLLPQKGESMRAGWVIILTSIFVLNTPLLQSVVADDEPDPASEERAKELIQGKLNRLHKRLEKQDELRTISPTKKSRGLGFESVDQLGKARPDTRGRFRVYYVGLDNLRAYDEGDDPWRLLERTNTFIYPVVAPATDKPEEQVRSAAVVDVELDEKNSEVNQQISMLGVDDTLPIHALVEARRSLMTELHTDKCRCFVIAIPALGTGFLGTRTAESFQIKVIKQGPGKLKKDALLPAKVVFDELAREAKKSKYDTPEEPGIRSLR